MRWNCPHCGSHLAVSDEKVGTSWSFSRCYKCGGFALVRRSDINLIKVDRAPPGEPVLLPEANEDPTALLSKTAAQNLARYTGASSVPTVQVDGRKPVIRPAARVLHRNGVRTSPVSAPSTLTDAPSFAPEVTPSPFLNQDRLPAPLPEEPFHGITQKLMPVALALTGMLVVGSGTYLYVQGRALWDKARAPAAQNREEATAEEPKQYNEIVQAPSLAPSTSPPPVSAPLAPQDPSTRLAAAATDSSAIGSQSTKSAHSEMTDEVHSNAMAPARIRSTPIDTDDSEPFDVTSRQIRVELLTDSAHIHSGPGMKYPVIGTASKHRKYAVEEWRDRWFKISLENPAAEKPAAGKARRSKKSAWIRNDLVRLAR